MWGVRSTLDARKSHDQCAIPFSCQQVPQYRPKAALAMFQRFIANEEYRGGGGGDGAYQRH